VASHFLEIEHKFLVDGAHFQFAAFRERVLTLHPIRRVTQSVRDGYYILEGDEGFIYRHRYDQELQHLTVKSIGGDAEERLEVNLDLGQHRGDQRAAVEKFLSVRGIAWTGTVHKDIEVFYFPDCEIVHYTAQGGGKTVQCVEFEALGAETLEAARATLRRYEEATGFGGAVRERRSLAELLFGKVTEWLTQAPSSHSL
jgi:hypothetical protein